MDMADDRSAEDGVEAADTARAAAAGPPAAAARPRRGRLRAAGIVTLGVVLVVALAVSVYEVFAPGTYTIAGGEATLSVSPAFHSGQIVLPLGPAGSVRLHTHGTPLDFSVSFVFSEDESIVTETRTLVGDLEGVGASAIAAFRSYAIGKVPWLCVMGLAGGALAAGLIVTAGGASRRWLHMLKGAGVGLLVVWVIVAALVSTTYATIDKTPAITYEGLAKHAPRVIALLRSVLASPESKDFSAAAFARGLEEVARQATASSPVSDGSSVTRLLVAGDLHDNLIGYRLLRRLAADEGLDVSGVVLVGDLTHVGTAVEAKFVLRYLKAIDKPVIMVGGNHEDAAAMREFEKAGVTELNDSSTSLDGVTLMGFADPLAYSPAALVDVKLRDGAAEEALTAVEAETPTPQVVLFHDVGQAKDVIRWAEKKDVLLTVLHGHDHVPSVEQEGSVTILDPGSGGASGFEQLGRDPDTPYQFQVVEFSSDGTPEPVAVITLGYEGLEGASSAEYLPLGQE